MGRYALCPSAYTAFAPGEDGNPAPGQRIFKTARCFWENPVRKAKIRQNQTVCLIDASYSYSASVTVPQRLGSVLIFWLPVHASCGIYSVPGQG